ncbi:MAG TPA: hypothetical protein VN667_17140 [Burkholderiales bacterium]|nr:hypothetical protein [Burkholderiales bacterium]
MSDVTVTIGEARVTVPAEAAARAYIDRLFGGHAASVHVEKSAPAIGERYRFLYEKTHTGIYAGITLHIEQPMALVLLDGESESLSYAEACEWAKGLGGELPSRVDALLLYKRLKDEFKEAAYWTNEVYAADADYAWGQDFGYGDQNFWRKSTKLRARAVRRVVL